MEYKNKVFELEQKICDLTKEIEIMNNENENKLLLQIEDSQFVKSLRSEITELT